LRNSSSLKKNDAYYQSAGLPIGVPSAKDFYRFKKVKKHLYGKSVLDIGPGRADFLNSIKTNYEITGVDMNIERVKCCNEILQQDAVQLGNLEKGLTFGDNSFDTVTCMEVLEHLEEPEKSLKELVRISRKRVIITVPFNEKIRYVLCIHCAKYTPYSGHLHSFNEQTIRDIIPHEAKILKIELISNKTLQLVSYFNKDIYKAPLFITSTLDRTLNHIFPRASWMMVILDKDNGTDKRH
jgi:ubiquinone/menaquinone biosynthesis C-methylase UbiE